MNQEPAEAVKRGGDPEPGRSAQRRRTASRVKDAREKLTSSGSGQRSYDIELLRIFAERRRGASLLLFVLALGTASLATLFVPHLLAGLWGGAMVLAVAGGSYLALRAPRDDALARRLLAWQRAFIAADALQGTVWASLAILLARVPNPSAGSFVLCVLLVVSAVTAMTSATVPLAAYAGLAPIMLALVGIVGPFSPHSSLPLLAVASGAQLVFVMLARRLYAGSLDTLVIQAEKDALIVELDQARLNSDEARRRAEEASLAKSRFLATMSHELRTPLNAILGFSEVMKGELFGAHANPVYGDYSADIHASGQHLLTLINEILDLSRIEAGRYDLNEEPFQLGHLVEDCQHLLSLRADKRGILLQVLIEPDLPRIWADERAIRQVVLNLLSNAIKFTPQSGNVLIKVGWTAQGGQYVSIRDSGPGIPEAEIPVVMSSFGRGTLAQKNADEGSGLGLPIVKGLVDLHGGSFLLRSRVREGTEAIVILPPQRVMSALPHLDVAEPGARAAADKRGSRSAA